MASIDESWFRKPEGIPEFDSAGGVVARVQEGQILIALVCEARKPLLVLPKGHVEAGESFEEAARREIEEEAGLTDLTLLGELGVRERLDFSRTEWKRTHYFLFLTRQTLGAPTDTHHAYVLHWLPLDAELPLFWPEQKELIASNRSRIEEMVAGAMRAAGCEMRDGRTRPPSLVPRPISNSPRAPRPNPEGNR